MSVKSSLRVRSRTVYRPIPVTSPASRARHVSGGSADHLKVSHYCQAALCIQCLECIHQSDWPATSQRVSSSQRPLWLHACLTSPRLVINVPPLMKNSLIKSVLTITTYCTVSFLLLHLLHRATTFDLVRTIWNYRNIMAIWLTPWMFLHWFFFSLCLSAVAFCQHVY